MRLYNTLTRQKEEFIPRKAGEVSMYGCGPTTYNYFHLGNARMLVVFDMIRRYFLYRGYQVTYVQNFTDVDDKIIARAAEENRSAQAVAEFYIQEYFKDAQALNIMPASIHPKATEHVDDMIEMIRVLEEKGLAYAVGGDVYFAVTRYEPYGRLSGRSLEDMRAGERVEVDERKENPMDFALWKKSAPGEPSWQSPWGMGRPGWHIECSAMSHKYLGPEFDIHGGGGDLVFPHHENEVAQSEAFMEGQYCARYWMHNAFITVKSSDEDEKEEKMSKSLKNFFLVRDVLQKFSGEVIRFYLLSTHYRSPALFDQEKLEMAAKGLERLKTSVRLADERLADECLADERLPKGQAEGGGIDEGLPLVPSDGDLQEEASLVCRVRQHFEGAMEDDFNSAQAFGVLFDLARDINSAVSQPEAIVGLAVMRETLVDLADVLGFDITTAQDQNDASEASIDGVMDIILELYGRAQSNGDEEMAQVIRQKCLGMGVDVDDVDAAQTILVSAQAAGVNRALVMDVLLELRSRARSAKNWAAADLIRDRCKADGIVIEDTRDGVRWYAVEGCL